MPRTPLVAYVRACREAPFVGMNPFFISCLAMPFLAGVLIGGSAAARSFVARHHRPCFVVGWAGVLLLIVGAVGLEGAPQAAALCIGSPLAGLSYWSPGGGDGGDDDDSPKPPGPDDEWERFLEDFRKYADARSCDARVGTTGLAGRQAGNRGTRAHSK